MSTTMRLTDVRSTLNRGAPTQRAYGLLVIALLAARSFGCGSDDVSRSDGAAGTSAAGSGGSAPAGHAGVGGDAGGGASDAATAGTAGAAGSGSAGSDDAGGDADSEATGPDGRPADAAKEAAFDGSSLRDASAEASEDANRGDASEPANAIDVYLIGGQSNATGQGYTKNLPSTFVVNTKVELYHSADLISGAAANTWIPLRHASEGPDAAGTRFGPELGFGNGIQAAYPTRKLAIIKHAKSGTNLVSQWAPGSGPSDSAHFGPEFKTFVNTVDGGLAALRAQGATPVVRGMLWQQGEADADLGGAASQQYGEHLSALISRVREQWSSPSMLFIYGYVYPRSNLGAGRDQVRQGETNVDQDSGNALAVKRAFVVNTDGLEARAEDPGTPYPSDLIHFGTAGQLDLGARMATKMHDKLGPL